MPRPFVKAVALSGVAIATALFAFSANATQTVDPFTAPTGGTNLHGTTIQKNVSQPVVFYGIYSDNSAGAESGLGLKVAYDATKLTNVTITEEYTKCRIAAAQKQEDAPATSQVVMGWIDTAIRPNGVVASSDGSVGWPDATDLTTGGCLNPGGINTDTAAASSTALKLFKFSATTAANFTGSTVVTLDAGQNYSYAGASPGFAQKSFTVQYSNVVAPNLAAAATRRTHTSGTFDLPVNLAGTLNASVPFTSGVLTVDPRALLNGNSAKIVLTFDSNVTSLTVSASVGGASTSAPTATVDVTTLNSTSVVVDVGAIADRDRVSLNISAINGTSVALSVPVGFLAGDVTGDGRVNGSDTAQVGGRAGLNLAVSSAVIAKYDVNVNGANVNGQDTVFTGQRAGVANALR